MQRQFNIELRVDYADNDKNQAMKEAMQRAARHVFAQAALLADGVKPTIAIYSDDFFSGHEEIALIEDTITKGIELVGGEDDQVSAEMAALAQSMKQG